MLTQKIVNDLTVTELRKIIKYLTFMQFKGQVPIKWITKQAEPEMYVPLLPQSAKTGVVWWFDAIESTSSGIAALVSIILL